MQNIIEQTNIPGIDFYLVTGVTHLETFYIVAIKGRLIKIELTNMGFNLTIHYWYDKTRTRKHLTENRVIEIIQDEYYKSLL